MPSGLYIIENVATGAFYVGSCKRFTERRAKHRYALRHDRHENQLLQQAWNCHGEAAFRFVDVARMPLADARQREQRLLSAWLGNALCYNLSPSIKGGMHGRTHSAESRARMADRQRGKTATASTRAKMSDAQRGRSMSVEARQRQSASQLARFAEHPRPKGQKMSSTAIERRQASRRRNAALRGELY